MPSYRCYLFNERNLIRDVVDFEAASDTAACEHAEKLHGGGHGVLELWRGENKIYCPNRELAREFKLVAARSPLHVFSRALEIVRNR